MIYYIKYSLKYRCRRRWIRLYSNWIWWEGGNEVKTYLSDIWKCRRIDLNTIYGVWYNKIISRVSFKPSIATDVIFHVPPLSIFTCIPPLIRWAPTWVCESKKFTKKVKFNRPLWNWISKAEKFKKCASTKKCKRYSFLRCTNYLY